MKKTSKVKVIKKKSANKMTIKKKTVKKKVPKKKTAKVKVAGKTKKETIKTKAVQKTRKKVRKRIAPEKKTTRAKTAEIAQKTKKKVKKKIASKAKATRKITKKTDRNTKTKTSPKSDESKGLKEIEDMLLNQRSDLLKMISKSSTWEKDISKLEHGDLEDMAATSLEREMTFAMSSREREEIHMINNALKKIAERAYGKCESCGDKISIKRLKIVPFAQYCIECKSNMEQEIELGRDSSYS